MQIGLNNLGLTGTRNVFSPASLFSNGEQGGWYEAYNPDSLLQRTNFVTYSEQIDNVAWSKNNTTVTPDADGTADKIIPNATNAQHTIQQIGVVVAGSAGVAVVRVKAGGYSWIAFQIGGNFVYFDIVNGVAGASSGAVGTIAAAADDPGYYDCAVKPTSGTLAGSDVTLFVATASGASVFAGDGVSGVYVRRVQANRNTLAPTAYQKVTDWNTEYLAAAGSRVHMWQDNLRTVPATAVEQTVGCWDDLSPNAKHATQATGASRPKLSARYNLATKTEQMTDAAWSKASAGVVDGISDPAGTLKASTITATAANGNFWQPTSAFAAQTLYKVWVRRRTGAGSVRLYNTDNATFTDIGAALTGAWQLFSTAAATQGGAGVQFVITTAGDAIDVAFPDWRTVNDWALSNPAYQRVNTATDYDTAGFIHYLKFDTTDDSLQTPAIPFNTVDKMTVWAGVTKLSDASVGIVAELTANGNSDGGFYFAAPGSVGANVAYCTRGTVAGTTGTAVSTAPATLTSVAQMDNAAATTATQLTARLNGASAALTYGTGPTSAGNFANAALNIGRRNNATLPFGGRLTSLTVRGSTTPASAAFVKSMEQYAAKLAGQTFVST